MYNTPLIESNIESHEWQWVWIASGGLMVLLLIPLVLAFVAAGPEMVFTGHLTEVETGAAHFAQMAQGYRGSWLYVVPFTPEEHQGVGLFTFYMALGHVARLLRIEPLLLYHAMRILGTLVMCLAVYQFAALWTVDVNQRRLTWFVALFGSGLDWLRPLFGQPFLVSPETFLLQGAYAYPHLPWVIMAIALAATIMVNAVFVWSERLPEIDFYTAGLVAAVFLLASTAPFSLVPLGLALLGTLSVRWYRTREFPRQAVGWSTIPLVVALPVGVYLLWAFTASEPVIVEWLQNVERLSPNPLILFALLVPLAALGGWVSRRRWHGTDTFLALWIVFAIVLAYLPFGFQDFFLIGVMLPISVLAGRAIYRVIGKKEQVLAYVVCALLVPSTLIAYVMLFTNKPEASYISIDQSDAFKWIDDNAEPYSVVLASPESSLLLPTYGTHVFYAGENTLHAESRQKSMLDYFAGTDCSITEDGDIDYILVGPYEEDLLTDTTCLPPTEPVYQNDTVTIYED